MKHHSIRVKGDDTKQDSKQNASDAAWEKELVEQVAIAINEFIENRSDRVMFRRNLISLFEKQLSSQKDQIIKELEGMKKETIKGGLNEAIRIAKGDETIIGNHMTNTWYNQGIDDVISAIKKHVK